MGGWRPCGAGLLLGLRLYRGLGAIHIYLSNDADGTCPVISMLNEDYEPEVQDTGNNLPSPLRCTTSDEALVVSSEEVIQTQDENLENLENVENIENF